MSDKIKAKTKYKSLLELESGDCRWPVGDPRNDGFHFCGAPQVAGRPYCIEHWPLSFVPAKSRHGASSANGSVTQVPALPAPARRAA